MREANAQGNVSARELAVIPRNRNMKGAGRPLTKTSAGAKAAPAEFPRDVQSLSRTPSSTAWNPAQGARSRHAQVVDGELRDGGRHRLGCGKAATPGTSGLANIRERLQLLYGNKASLTVAENTGGGTAVSITVPYNSHGGTHS